MAKDFSEGQIWKYETRSVEPASELVIVQINNLNGQEIFHISLRGLKLKNPSSDDSFGEGVSHIPISREALTESVTKLLGDSDQLPDYREGYKIWREAYDAGNAGVFSISVKESIDFMERTVNQ